MIASLRSDIRKILTVRSTYFMFLFALFLIGGTSFYFEGYKGNTGSAAATLSSDSVVTIINSNASLAVIFIAIIAILFMAHEYRYNTIMYTLTSNASRTKVILSKIISISLMSVLFGIIVSIVGVVMYLIGLSLRGADLPAQNINELSTIFHILFYFVGYGLIGLFIAVIIRSLVGAIAFFFIYPSTIEQIGGALILKSKEGYLPFKSLDAVVHNSYIQNPLSPNTAMVVATVYIVIFGVIAWALFLRRDAN